MSAAIIRCRASGTVSSGSHVFLAGCLSRGIVTKPLMFIASTCHHRASLFTGLTLAHCHIINHITAHQTRKCSKISHNLSPSFRMGRSYNITECVSKSLDFPPRLCQRLLVHLTQSIESCGQQNWVGMIMVGIVLDLRQSAHIGRT